MGGAIRDSSAGWVVGSRKSQTLVLLMLSYYGVVRRRQELKRNEPIRAVAAPGCLHKLDVS
jgi:hypothetical protein